MFISAIPVSASGACFVSTSQSTVSFPTKQHVCVLKWYRRSLIRCGLSVCMRTLGGKGEPLDHSVLVFFGKSGYDIRLYFHL